MNVYRLSNEIRAALQAVEDGGELTADLLKDIERLSGDVPRTIETLVLWLRETEIGEVALRLEAAALAKAARAKADRVERLQAEVMGLMAAAGIDRATAGVFAVRLADSVGKIVVDDVACPVESLPAEFVRVTMAPNLSALQAAAKAGRELPAGVSVVRGKFLKIGPK